jgi:hypothetical protein
MRHIVVPALILVVGLMAQPARAQDVYAHQAFWKGVPETGVIRECTPGSAAHWEARDALRRFERQVETLDAAAPVDGPRQQLQDLLHLPCFALAFESLRVPVVDSVPSLKSWLERGGDVWLESLLELPRFGDAAHVIVPPDAPRTLRPGGTHHHAALDAYLCGPGDGACGHATRGWVMRAGVALERHRLASAHDSTRDDVSRPGRSAEAVSADCARAATTEPDALRYEAWRACVENYRDRRPLVPVAEFRAPDAGWLVVTGRRGHYDFCDTVRAFNLADGATLMDDSCSSLVLQAGGDVNFDATNRRRVTTTRMGRVPVDALREAAWMLLFRHQFVEGQHDADAVPLPEGFERQWDRAHPPWNFSITYQGGWVSTAQTSLTWVLTSPGGPPIGGNVTWPTAHDGADTHAAELLQVAEAGFADTCLTDRAPAFRKTDAALVESYVDLEEMGADLARAQQRWSSAPQCR